MSKNTFDLKKSRALNAETEKISRGNGKKVEKRGKGNKMLRGNGRKKKFIYLESEIVIKAKCLLQIIGYYKDIKSLHRIFSLISRVVNFIIRIEFINSTNVKLYNGLHFCHCIFNDFGVVNFLAVNLAVLFSSFLQDRYDSIFKGFLEVLNKAKIV